ncbi:3'-5' exonuclease [Puccinia graminis f. sp. tritici]|uniref:RNA exonuclease 4 n=1 Tax=Puccinia graminis f. sp. tritici TaxID=56615 RepID=A0A5B0QN92_PUCGR|nr:3'-5' exonuclease [Puccinia graminis f. sp. tritici]
MTDPSSSSSRKRTRKPGRPSSNWKTLQTALPQVPAAVKARTLEKKKNRNQAIHSSRTQASTSTTPSITTSLTSQKLLDILQKNPTQQATKKQTEVGKYLAIDCEMVGVGPRGNEQSALARVSIVNYYGNVVLDTYVQPKEKVTDYRTWVSGIKPEHLHNASTFEDVTRKVADLIHDKILIGHAISNDLQALLLTHPRQLIRDTSTYQPLRQLAKTKFPSLKKLTLLLLDIEIQKDSHCSVDDARATLAIYRTQKDQWEALVKKEQARQPQTRPAT